VPLDRAVNVPNSSLANSYINIANNITQLGGSETPPNRGTTGNQPTSANIGDQYFNITTNELQVYSTNGWVPAATAPNAPTNVTVSSAPVAYGGQPSVIVSWTPATTGIPASSYVVASSTGGFSQTVTTNTATFIGLTAGTSYTFTVKAQNDYGSNSTTSGSITPVTVPQQITLSNPTITAAGLSVNVTPGNTGGSAITGYTLYAQPGNIAVTSATSPVVFTTIVPVTGGSITNNTQYSFSGVANNIAGSSVLSSTTSSEIDLPTQITSGIVCDYDFYNGSYGGQNLLLYSNAFSNSPWYYTYTGSSSNMSRTANATTDPFGGNNAWLMTDTAFVGGDAAIVQGVSGITGTTPLTLSIYIKANQSNPINSVTLACFYIGNNTAGASITFTPGTSTITGGSGSATYVGNGWYRYTLNATGTNAANNAVVYQVYFNGTGSYYAYGAQLQPTSSTLAPGYLPTTSSSINSSTGSTIYDLSGNGYNTTLANFTYSNTSANGYGGVFFNGTSTSGGTMPNMGSGYPATTLSFWANRQAGSAGGADMIVSGSLGYNFGDASWDGPYGEWYYPHAITPPYDGSQWHHYTFVNNSNYSYSIYHDGYLEGTYAPGGTGTSNLSGIIIANGYGGRYFKGYIGKLSVYTRALSASEVLQNFNAHRSRYGV